MKKGFTLVELLLIMVIFSILASIIYPSYQNFLLCQQRNDAKMALIDLASRMERYKIRTHTYLTATVGTGKESDVRASALTPLAFYQLSIVNQTATTYLLQAAPRGVQTKDRACQSFLLNHLGKKDNRAGPAGSPPTSRKNCWK